MQPSVHWRTSTGRLCQSCRRRSPLSPLEGPSQSRPPRGCSGCRRQPTAALAAPRCWTSNRCWLPSRWCIRSGSPPQPHQQRTSRPLAIRVGEQGPSLRRSPRRVAHNCSRPHTAKRHLQLVHRRRRCARTDRSKMPPRSHHRPTPRSWAVERKPRARFWPARGVAAARTLARKLPSAAQTGAEPDDQTYPLTRHDATPPHATDTHRRSPRPSTRANRPGWSTRSHP